MDIIHKEKLYYTIRDTHKKYKVRGDCLRYVTLEDGSELGVSKLEKMTPEQGIVLERSSEKASSERTEYCTTIKITRKDMLPLTITYWNEDSYSAKGFDKEDSGEGLFDIRLLWEGVGPIAKLKRKVVRIGKWYW